MPGIVNFTELPRRESSDSHTNFYAVRLWQVTGGKNTGCSRSFLAGASGGERWPLCVLNCFCFTEKKKQKKTCFPSHSGSAPVLHPHPSVPLPPLGGWTALAPCVPSCTSSTTCWTFPPLFYISFSPWLLFLSACKHVFISPASKGSPVSCKLSRHFSVHVYRNSPWDEISVLNFPPFSISFYCTLSPFFLELTLVRLLSPPNWSHS